MIHRVWHFVVREKMLVIAAVAACVSFAFIEAGTTWWEAIDLRVLTLLFCLMGCVAGFSQSGALALASRKLVQLARTPRALAATLTMLPFFGSMVLTNDVSLLAFVPVAILVMTRAGLERQLPRLVVLQTLAANLGGMLLPFGSPQNLLVYTTFGVKLLDFIAILAPYVIASGVLVGFACLLFSREPLRDIGDLGTGEAKQLQLDRRRCALHAILFLLCVLCVVRVVPHYLLFGICLAVWLVADRRALRKIDYALLATFACFFVFAGNVGHIESVRALVSEAMEAQPFLLSLGASQVISNVPASILLAGFTDNWQALLLGVDIGGLGTPIASLASLIAARLYLNLATRPDFGAFAREYIAWTAIALAVLLALHAVI